MTEVHTNLHNIRGMLNEIKKQEVYSENKKKLFFFPTVELIARCLGDQYYRRI